MSVPIDITDDTLASSLVPVQCASLAPPALFKKGEEGRKKKDVLHLSRCYTHTHHFVTHNSHTTLSRISFTHNFVTHTQLCHTKLFRTTLSQIPFTHNFVTHNSFNTQLFHTHTHFCHIHLFHTYNLLHTNLSRTTLSHTTLLHTQTHTQHCHTHTQLFHPTWLACAISFPACLSHLIFTSAWWSLEEADMWGYPVR